MSKIEYKIPLFFINKAMILKKGHCFCTTQQEYMVYLPEYYEKYQSTGTLHTRVHWIRTRVHSLCTRVHLYILTSWCPGFNFLYGRTLTFLLNPISCGKFLILDLFSERTNKVVQTYFQPISNCFISSMALFFARN